MSGDRGWDAIVVGAGAGGPRQRTVCVARTIGAADPRRAGFDPSIDALTQADWTRGLFRKGRQHGQGHIRAGPGSGANLCSHREAVD
jgi:hypothetical protein